MKPDISVNVPEEMELNQLPISRINSIQAQLKSPTMIVEFRTLTSQISTNRTEVSKKRKGAKDPKEAIKDINVHKLDPNQIYLKFSTHPTLGLEPPAVERMQKTGKLNKLSPPKTNYLQKILIYVFGGFNSLMWIAMLLSILSYEPLGGSSPQVFNLGVAALLFFVILIASVFYAVVDWNTSKVMKAITQMVADNAFVTRDGEKKKIPSSHLFPGDIVHLSLGDRVPADLYLLEISPDLKFDRSILTGETEPISGSTTMTDENPLETKNLAFSSTFVVQGSATGVVFATGDDTVIGNIIAIAATQKPMPSNLQREINHFTMIISVLALTSFIIAMIVWGAWLRVVYPNFADASAAIINAIGCLTAFVPQGLPVCVALALSIVANRMAKRKVLVKNLSTIETVGSMSVLCSDKTGTLTEGKMHVEGVAFIDKDFKTFEELKATQGGVLALNIGYQCNDSFFEVGQESVPLKDKKIKGNSTDVAVYRFCAAGSLDSRYERVYSIPFNSKNKWMLSIHKINGEYELFVKGAPDILGSMCSSIMNSDGRVDTLDSSLADLLNEKQNNWTSQGQRVILMCRKKLEGIKELAVNDDRRMEEFVAKEMNRMTVVCLVGIRDPPRSDVPAAVRTIRDAGVRVFMVTGDFKLTAESIAKQIGLLTVDKVDDYEALAPLKSSVANLTLADMKPANGHVGGIVITGSQVDLFRKEDWDVLLTFYNEVVFARTSPQQKMIIVEECKKRGDNVVAVTGDGVNDSPALKAADIGLAMGAGSDVAKEAAAMILMNNDFASIPIAIENGRLVFENLRKVVLYVMPAGSYTELMAVIANVFFGIQIPLNSYLQVIFSILNDVTMSISLMFEQPESDLMKRKPRNVRLERLTDWKFYLQIYGFIGVIIWLSCYGMFFYYWSTQGFGFYDLIFVYDRWTDGYKGEPLTLLNSQLAVSQSIFYVTMAIMQLGSILSIRNRKVSIIESNPFYGPRKNLTLLVCICVHLLVVVCNVYISTASWSGNLFQLGYVDWQYWLIPIPLAIGLLLLDEMRKLTARQFPNSFIAKAAW